MGNPVFVKRIATGAGSSIRFGRSGGRKFGRPAKTRCPSGDKVPSDDGVTNPRSSKTNTVPSGAGRAAKERFDLQKDFEWSLRQSHPVVQSLDQSRRHKDRPASLDPAPLGRPVPMPKPRCNVNAFKRIFGITSGSLGRAAPNRRSLMRPLDLGLQIPVLLHPRGPKRRFPFRRGK